MAKCWCLTVCLTPHGPCGVEFPEGAYRARRSCQRSPRHATPGRRWPLAGATRGKSAVDGWGGRAPAAVYPRYRAGHRPLPRRLRGRGLPLPAGPGRPHTRHNRRPLPASKYHPPRAERSTIPSAMTVHWTPSTAACHVLPGHIVVHERCLTHPRTPNYAALHRGATRQRLDAGEVA